MKKSLIASAVAAATLSTSAFAMEPVLPTIYGNIQLAHINTSYDDNINNTTAGDLVNGEDNLHELIDNGSTLGFKHETAVNEDVTAFFKAEFHFDADGSKYHNDGGRSPNQGLGEEIDEAYIGVKGSFGSVQVGADDTVYEWVDMFDSGEAIYIEGELAWDTEGDNVQYVSPEIADGLVLGLTYPTDSDTPFGGSFAAKYSMDNLNVAFAYSMGREEGNFEAGDSFGLAGSFVMDDFTVVAQFESRDESKSSGTADKNDTDFWGLQGIYAMGANKFKLGYAMVTEDYNGGDEETSMIEFQALHNVSDNMYVYLEYLTSTTENSASGVKDIDSDGLALGATYYF